MERRSIHAYPITNPQKCPMKELAGMRKAATITQKMGVVQDGTSQPAML